jgi:DNA-binding transcriptional MerR regulator
MEQMPHEIPDKLFYKASEVCQITDTQPYVLRFWESEFPQLASEKNRSGQRVYRRQDIDLVFRIKQLLYQEEYTIAGARKAIDDAANPSAADTSPRARSRRPAMPDDDEDVPAAHAAPPPVAPPAPLFGETRPESPAPAASARAEEEARYRAQYEEAMVTLASLKTELARADGNVEALRERNRRIAARIEAALES